VQVALDATYSVDPRPSGIAVYSRELLDGLAALHSEDRFLHCYRAKQLRHSPKATPSNVRRRLLLPGFPTFRADLFHALNQRVDARPAKKVISTFHDLFVMTGNYSSTAFQQRFTEQARRAAQNSDLIITVSSFTAGQVASLLHVEPARIRVIPHGVRMPAPTAVATEQTQREKLILFVGALQVRKNIVRLVEAFEAMPAHHHWRLVLAGSPTGYGADQILRRIEQSRCRLRIEITGYISTSALEQFYARASIFAFPSLDEGFGMPVLEAMARGIPVVTSKCSALPEVAGDAAILVDPESTEQITAALIRLADDPQLAASLVGLGRARAETYPWRRAVDSTYSVYQELLG
jgi:glycosyltransferase involved in cell wall biosynthesis